MMHFATPSNLQAAERIFSEPEHPYTRRLLASALSRA